MYRRSGRGRLLLLIFLALCIVVITLDFRRNPGGPLRRAKDVAVAVVAPIQRGFTSVTRPVGDLFSSLADLADLRSENARLENEVKELRQQVQEMPALAEENEEFRGLFELEKSWRTMDVVTASVIAEVPSNYKWAVLIDKGRAHGIRSNMAVVYLDGLVGKVIRVTDDAATVLLLIDPDAAARARIAGEGDAGTVRGNGENELLSLEFVGTDANVSVGDEVVTSSYNQGVFPPGIPIGVVAGVGGEDAATEKEIEVEPSVDFSSQQFVTVLLETGDRVKKGK
jgi:rod shape-determining protein MreC